MEFPSWAEYERLIYGLPETYPQIATSIFPPSLPRATRHQAQP
jgi:hypothetical protein